MKVTLDRPAAATNRNLLPALAAYIARLLRSLGYEVATKQLPIDEYFATINKADSTQIGPTGWIPDFPTPTGFSTERGAATTLAPGSVSNANPSAFCDPAIDRKAEPCEIIPRQEPGRRKQTLGTG